MKRYAPRLIDQELANALKIAGAVLICGPKTCGKSETAKQQAASILQVDRDSLGLEADAIVQKPNGDCAVFEIKLGEGYIDDGVKSLTAFTNNVIEAKGRRIVSRNVIVGSGYAYTRPDGINIIPIRALGA